MDCWISVGKEAGFVVVLRTVINDPVFDSSINVMTKTPFNGGGRGTIKVHVIKEFQRIKAYLNMRQARGRVYVQGKQYRRAIRERVRVWGRVGYLGELRDTVTGQVADNAAPDPMVERLFQSLALSSLPLVFSSEPLRMTGSLTRRLGGGMVVATDGSACRELGLGWAFVAADGRCVVANSRAGTDSILAELLAITLALDSFREPVDILTDFKLLVDWIDYPTVEKSHYYHAWFELVRRRLVESRSTLHWVKGHDGFRLNERAHSLARVARLALGSGSSDRATEIAARVSQLAWVPSPLVPWPTTWCDEPNPFSGQGVCFAGLDVMGSWFGVPSAQ